MATINNLDEAFTAWCWLTSKGYTKKLSYRAFLAKYGLKLVLPPKKLRDKAKAAHEAELKQKGLTVSERRQFLQKDGRYRYMSLISNEGWNGMAFSTLVAPDGEIHSYLGDW